MDRTGAVSIHMYIHRYKKEGLRWIARALREGGAAVMAAGGPQVSRCTYIHTCIEIHR